MFLFSIAFVESRALQLAYARNRLNMFWEEHNRLRLHELPRLIYTIRIERRPNNAVSQGTVQSFRC